MNPIYSFASLDALPDPTEVRELTLSASGGNDWADGEGEASHYYRSHNRAPNLNRAGGSGVFDYGATATAIGSAAVDDMRSGWGVSGRYEEDQDEGGDLRFNESAAGYNNESSRLLRRSGSSKGAFPDNTSAVFYAHRSPFSFGNLDDDDMDMIEGVEGVNDGGSFVVVGHGGTAAGHQPSSAPHSGHQRTGTVAGVTMNTLCNVMGAGVLALPLAFHNGSIVTSLVLLFFSAFISLKAVHILGVSCDAVHRYSFTECVVLSLFPAPIEERRECIAKGIDPMLHSMKRLVATFLLELVIVVESFGTLVVYARVIADSMPPVLTGLGLPSEEHPYATLFLSWVLPALIFFALSCSRSMEELKWTSLVGFGTILYIVFIVVYKYVGFVVDNSPALNSGSASAHDFWDLLLNYVWPSHYASTAVSGGASSAPTGNAAGGVVVPNEGIVFAAKGVRMFALDSGAFATMSTYSLAFGYHFNVPYFYSELKERKPTNLLKTVYYALPVVTISYALTGALGYLQVGPSVAGRGGGNIVDRMDPTSFLVNLGRIGLLFHFATVYPVISVCARRGLHRLLALSQLFVKFYFTSRNGKKARNMNDTIKSDNPSSLLAGKAAVIGDATTSDSKAHRAKASVKSRGEGSEMVGGNVETDMTNDSSQPLELVHFMQQGEGGNNTIINGTISNSAVAAENGSQTSDRFVSSTQPPTMEGSVGSGRGNGGKQEQLQQNQNYPTVDSQDQQQRKDQLTHSPSSPNQEVKRRARRHSSSLRVIVQGVDADDTVIEDGDLSGEDEENEDEEAGEVGIGTAKRIAPSEESAASSNVYYAARGGSDSTSPFDALSRSKRRVLPPKRRSPQLDQEAQQRGRGKVGMPARSANFSVNSFSNLPLFSSTTGKKAPPVPGDPSTTTRASIVLEALFIVALGTIMAWNVPGVGLVIEFLGAFFGIPTQMILPGIIGIKLFRASSGYSNRWWMVHVVERSSMRREYRYAVMLVVVGVVCTVFGVGRALGDERGGPPETITSHQNSPSAADPATSSSDVRMGEEDEKTIALDSGDGPTEMRGTSPNDSPSKKSRV